MNLKKQLLSDLRDLELNRQAVAHIAEEISVLEKDEKTAGLSAEQRKSLRDRREVLQSCLIATVNRVSSMEKLLYRLTPDEEKVITRMLIHPEPGCVFDLAEELNCESASIYRIRAQALKKLGRLSYGAAWN